MNLPTNTSIFVRFEVLTADEEGHVVLGCDSRQYASVRTQENYIVTSIFVSDSAFR
jgi:hypothetical protein